MMKQKPNTTKTLSLSHISAHVFVHRDASGILRVPLDLKHYRLRFASAYICMGVISTTIGCSVLLLWYGRHHRILYATSFLIIEGVFILAFGLRNLWLWRKLHRLTSASILCEQFGLDAEQLKLLASENSILPGAIVGVQDYFRMSDFGDITTLLRASIQPAPAANTLLRPAANVIEEDGEQLLRAKA